MCLSTSVLYLFQDPAQDPILHVFVSSPGLLPPVTFPWFSLVFHDLDLGKSTRWISHRPSLRLSRLVFSPGSVEVRIWGKTIEVKCPVQHILSREQGVDLSHFRGCEP